MSAYCRHPDGTPCRFSQRTANCEEPCQPNRQHWAIKYGVMPDKCVFLEMRTQKEGYPDGPQDPPSAEVVRA